MELRPAEAFQSNMKMRPISLSRQTVGAFRQNDIGQ